MSFHLRLHGGFRVDSCSLGSVVYWRLGCRHFRWILRFGNAIGIVDEVVQGRFETKVKLDLGDFGMDFITEVETLMAYDTVP